LRAVEVVEEAGAGPLISSKTHHANVTFNGRNDSQQAWVYVDARSAPGEGCGVDGHRAAGSWDITRVQLSEHPGRGLPEMIDIRKSAGAPGDAGAPPRLHPGATSSPAVEKGLNQDSC
jgi:hypothetical protein